MYRWFVVDYKINDKCYSMAERFHSSTNLASVFRDENIVSANFMESKKKAEEVAGIRNGVYFA